ncbi:hypothetical protein Mnod_0858 [Methylobacterium nodulans ORS 2060]|uniref:Uncharacterized protein n=1 Tax=Methylobacterium nodulans (strain LMG 21967 / CNCM I-2342 / ORS 2060) TaxID=460265 RepID=B8IGI2_METNO|nr:hypothetical protein Mnod_0858 [Methylobacterium nodulans ORS 2060]
MLEIDPSPPIQLGKQPRGPGDRPAHSVGLLAISRALGTIAGFAWVYGLDAGMRTIAWLNAQRCERTPRQLRSRSALPWSPIPANDRGSPATVAGLPRAKAGVGSPVARVDTKADAALRSSEGS